MSPSRLQQVQRKGRPHHAKSACGAQRHAGQRSKHVFSMNGEQPHLKVCGEGAKPNTRGHGLVERWAFAKDMLKAFPQDCAATDGCGTVDDILVKVEGHTVEGCAAATERSSTTRRDLGLSKEVLKGWEQHGGAAAEARGNRDTCCQRVRPICVVSTEVGAALTHPRRDQSNL